MINLCKYCQLHGADRDGYCSDVCRRSMALLLAAEALFARVNKANLRQLQRAAAALR